MLRPRRKREVRHEEETAAAPNCQRRCLDEWRRCNLISARTSSHTLNAVLLGRKLMVVVLNQLVAQGKTTGSCLEVGAALA